MSFSSSLAPPLNRDGQGCTSEVSHSLLLALARASRRSLADTLPFTSPWHCLLWLSLFSLLSVDSIDDTALRTEVGLHSAKLFRTRTVCQD